MQTYRSGDLSASLRSSRSNIVEDRAAATRPHNRFGKAVDGALSDEHTAQDSAGLVFPTLKRHVDSCEWIPLDTEGGGGGADLVCPEDRAAMGYLPDAGAPPPSPGYNWWYDPRRPDALHFYDLVRAGRRGAGRRGECRRGPRSEPTLSPRPPDAAQSSARAARGDCGGGGGGAGRT